MLAFDSSVSGLLTGVIYAKEISISMSNFPSQLRRLMRAAVGVAAVAGAVLMANCAAQASPARTAQAAQAAQSAPARVKIQNGNVVTANGEALRGAPFFMSIFNTKHMRDNETTYRDYFKSISRDYGMNCVRVCPWVGNWEYDIKNNSNHQSEMLYMMDKCVQWGAEDGIYVVLDMHIQFGTVLTRQKAKDFWGVVAPRYKDNSNVIFEAVNEPDVPSAKSTMTGIYQDIRALAPNTHIILWSLADPGITNGNFDIADLNNASNIDYSNASFGFHVYDWQLGDTRRWERAKKYRDAGYPVICTEMMSFQDADNIPIYYPYLVENIKHARQYNMSWIQWAPRFNYASIDQYGNNSLTNDDIGFKQKYKDELLAAGINFWSGGASANLNGTYEIKCKWGAYSLSNASTSSGAAVRMANPSSANSTRWILEQVSGDVYRLKSKTGTNLYLQGNSTSYGNVKVATLNTNSAAQKWTLEKVSGTTYRLKCNATGNYYLHGANVADQIVRNAPLDTTWSSQQWIFAKQ